MPYILEKQLTGVKINFPIFAVNCIPFNFMYISQLNRHDLDGVMANLHDMIMWYSWGQGPSNLHRKCMESIDSTVQSQL